MARKTLFRSVDADGTVEVVQEPSGVRTLHFGTASKQTVLDPQAPHKLILPYTRALTAGLLFRPDPGRILLIGLGGGALVHFFLHHFPRARIDVVERCPRVLAAARELFALPEGDPRLRVHLGDGREFLAHPGEAGGGGWDFLITDAFDARGPAEGTLARAFHETVRSRLSEGGVLAANLWSGQSGRLRRSLRTMETVYGRPVYRLRPKGKANVAALAGRPGLPERESVDLESRAVALQERLGLEYPRFLADMSPAGGGWLRGLA